MNFLTSYHLSGLASAFFVTLSLTGLLLQVKFIHTRKIQLAAGQLADERPTSAISLNRFFASYIGFYSLMVYGLCLERLNHYLVWPRLLAVLIILVILHAILVDRKGMLPAVVFGGCVLLLLVSALIRVVGAGTLTYSTLVAQILVVAATILFLQGAIHQVIKIRRAGRTGGLSLSMHQLFFIKDFFSTLFGVAMGLQQGWPLLMFNGLSMVMQCTIIWHFRWARTSAVAGERRILFVPPD